MKKFKEYYYMKANEINNLTSNSTTEELIIRLNEDRAKTAKEQVQLLLSILRDYGERISIPSVVRSRARQLAMELERILRSL